MKLQIFLVGYRIYDEWFYKYIINAIMLHGL